jgi:hypothetical protein
VSKLRNEDLEDLFKGDQIDQANARMELRLRAALAQRKPEAPAATGFCFNCEARLAPKLRFCDASCRDDWQAHQAKLERATALAPREPDEAA